MLRIAVSLVQHQHIIFRTLSVSVFPPDFHFCYRTLKYPGLSPGGADPYDRVIQPVQHFLSPPSDQSVCDTNPPISTNTAFQIVPHAGLK